MTKRAFVVLMLVTGVVACRDRQPPPNTGNASVDVVLPGARPVPKASGPAVEAPPAVRAPAPGRLDPGSRFVHLRAPAGNQPSTRSIRIDGYLGAILPNGRLLTPAGQEINVDAPKPF